MTNQDQQMILAELKQILAKFTTNKHISPSSRLEEDLGLDSMDKLELVMSIEDEFLVELPDDGIIACVTVQDIVELIGRHTAE